MWQSLYKDKIALCSTAVLFLLLIAAFSAPWLAPHDPYNLETLDIMDSEIPPFWQQQQPTSFVLGTDDQGRDLLSTMMYGTRISLLIGFGALLLQLVIGVTIGLIAGFFGGSTDAILMRIADIQMSYSTMMVAIVALAVFQAAIGQEQYATYALWMLIVVIGMAEWPKIARTVRAGTLAEKEKEYIQAMQVIGAPTIVILWRHILPNTLTSLFVISTVQLAEAIVTEAALSFLGLGMPTATPSLGSLISSGFDYIFSGSWWITLIPGVVLVALVLSTNLLSDWLRDFLNPKLYKHER